MPDILCQTSPYEKPDRHHLPDDCRVSWKCGDGREDATTRTKERSFMKKFYAAVVIACFALIPATGAYSSELKIVHTDSEWKDGKGDVPNKGICAKHGGDGWSPSLNVENIPKSTVSLRILFTDDDYGDEGGHGVFRVKIDGKKSYTIPSFGGPKYSTPLPKDMQSEGDHHCMDCQARYYLGPCSGGRNHTYRVNIYAKDVDNKTLSKGTILLGRF